MPRPWQPTEAEIAKDGPFADYTSFKRWWQKAIEDTIPESEDDVWDGLNIFQQIWIYAALAKAFDDMDEKKVVELAKDGEKAFGDGPQAWADWNAKALDFRD